MASSAKGLAPDEITAFFEAVHWFQGVWVPDIVRVLADGPARFEDLRRAIDNAHSDRWWFTRPSRLSNSQLSRTLMAMQRNLLVHRTENRAQVPIAVTYELSPLLLDFLHGPISPLAAWLEQHQDALETVRRRHRQRRAVQQDPGACDPTI